METWCVQGTVCNRINTILSLWQCGDFFDQLFDCWGDWFKKNTKQQNCFSWSAPKFELISQVLLKVWLFVLKQKISNSIKCTIDELHSFKLLSKNSINLCTVVDKIAASYFEVIVLLYRRVTAFYLLKPTSFMAATSNKIFEVSWINVTFSVLRSMSNPPTCRECGLCGLYCKQRPVFENLSIPVSPNSHHHSVFLILEKRSFDIQNVTMIWYRFRFKPRRRQEVWCISSKWIESAYLFLGWLDSIQ